MLGDRYLELDFENHPQQYALTGIGADVVRSLIVPATLQFQDEHGDPHRVRCPMLVPEPIPASPTDGGNWRLPSLLGCDILRHFDLELSYQAGTVALLEAAV